MVEVYVIKSEVNRELYVGMALSAERRLKEHNGGKNRYTKGLRPWQIVFKEIFADWASARKREKYLKSGIGKEFLKSMVP